MKYLLLPILFITGCATTPQAPVIQIQKEEVPVAVLCKTPEPEVPQFNIPNLKKSDDIFTKTKSILADNELYKGYTVELLAALRSCK